MNLIELIHYCTEQDIREHRKLTEDGIRALMPSKDQITHVLRGLHIAEEVLSRIKERDAS